MFTTPARRIARGATVGLGGAALAFGVAVVPVAPAEAAAAPGTEINLVTYNDFHGALSVGEEFACTVVDEQAQHENSFLISGGDNVGGSEFASAIQDDEPTLDYLTALGTDAAAVGNHEFDQGQDDLTGRIEQNAGFPHVAANVYKADGSRLSAPWTIVEKNGLKVAVVGAVTTKTIDKVSPAAIKGLSFRDPVDEVNKAVEELKKSGEQYDLLIASYHEGASGSAEIGSTLSPPNSDPIFDRIVNETHPDVEAIINGDSHKTYAFEGIQEAKTERTRPIIQAGASGAFVGSVTLKLNADGTDWIAVEAPQLIATEGKDLAACADSKVYADATSISNAALDKAEIIGAEQVGTIGGDITTSWDTDKAEYVDGVWTKTQEVAKGDNRTRHSAAGNMLADSMKWFLEKRGTNEGEEIIGFMNPGGIRAEFWYDQSGAEGDGVVTLAEANNMVPFGNTLYSGKVTGAQFVQMLEEQWGEKGFLAFSVSENISYAYDSTAEAGSRLIDVRVNGKPIDLEASYTIVGASFLFEGGDGMATLAKATDIKDTGVLDRDALSEYLAANKDLQPDYSQRQVEVQSIEQGKYSSEEGIDQDPVLRFRGLESQSLGAPKIEKVIVDAGEYGTFEAPYTQDDDGAWYADVTFTDWLCVPEGTEVPLTITAVPDTGTEYVIDMPAFTWENGNAPAECGGGDQDGDDQGGDQGGDDQGDDQGGDQGGGDQGGDDQTGGGTDGDGEGTGGDDGSADRPKDPGYRAPESSDIARTGTDAAPLGAAALLLTLAGLGAYGLRSRVGRD